MPHLSQQLAHCFQGRVCLVGVGNVDRGDDALGVRLAETVDRGMAGTVLLAGATPERHLTHLTDAGFDHVIFLDAVEFGGAPGSVVFLNAKEMETRFPQVSTHNISLGLLARWIESNGTTRAWLLGVQPASCRSGAPLSSPVQHSMELLTELLTGIAQSSCSGSAEVLRVARNRRRPPRVPGSPGARTIRPAPSGQTGCSADKSVRAPCLC